MLTCYVGISWILCFYNWIHRLWPSVFLSVNDGLGKTNARVFFGFRIEVKHVGDSSLTRYAYVLIAALGFKSPNKPVFYKVWLCSKWWLSDIGLLIFKMKRRHKIVILTSALIPAGVSTFLDNYSAAATSPILTVGCYYDSLGLLSCSLNSSGILGSIVD